MRSSDAAKHIFPEGIQCPTKTNGMNKRLSGDYHSNGYVDVGFHCLVLACGSCLDSIQAFLEALVLCSIAGARRVYWFARRIGGVNVRPARFLHSTLAFWLRAVAVDVHMFGSFDWSLVNLSMQTSRRR